MSAVPQQRRHKTFAPRVAPPVAVRTRKKRPDRVAALPVVDPRDWSPADSGRPLEPEVRRRLEAALQRPLGHVRVHTHAFDRDRVYGIGARAFAHRHHIWLGAHESPSDVALLAHEVTHVVQQGFAPRAARATTAPAPTVTPVLAGPGFAGVVVGGRAVAPARPAAAAPVAAAQRWELDLLGRARRAAGAVGSGIRSAGRAVASGARAVGGAIVDAGEHLLEMGREALIGFVRERWPDFARLLERDGITGFIRNLVERGLRAMFEGLLGPLRGIFNFDALGARVSQAVGWMSTIAGQLARGDCSGILAAARQVRQFFSTALQPVFDKIRSIADKVTGFFRSIWQSIGAPIMDLLRGIGGRIWESLRGFMRDVGAVIRRVRAAVGRVWDRVKAFFGVRAEEGEEEGGGIWNWIRDKATAVGEAISSVIRPVLGPLRNVAGVLLMIVPGGQILGVMLLWPRLRQAWDWLAQRWNDLNLIPRARHFLVNTVLPALMNAAESVGQALVNAADWLLGIISRVAGIVATAAEAATGILSPLGRVIRFAHQQFQRIVNWARGGLRWASRNMRSLLQRLIRFLGIVLDGLKQLIAIVVNPFGIVGFLLGTIWRLIPECLKGPIIDFILDLLIRLLRALPPMPQLGLLWPLIKSAALGFLEKVLSFSLQRKVNVSNKMARIISGMSPSFAFGYLKGLALGVWDGIIAPFQAIAAIFELPTLLQNFLSSLGLRLCELIESIRCFGAELAGRVFGGIDDILRGLGELLENPSRIIELIRCAIEGALAGAHSLGGSLANQMMEIFESADDAIGEMLGKITGSVLVQAVITYFTAGAGAAVGIIRQISSALGAVGRALGAVVRTLSQLFGRLVGFLRGLASRFASAAASGARSVLGRLGGFFRRVAGWFGRLLRRIFRGVRRRLMLTPAERAMWTAFRSRVSGSLLGHPQGITKGHLRTTYRGILASHRQVAKWPAFITKHGPYWRLWVRRVKSIRPRRVGHVLLDRVNRWKQGKKAVKAAIRRLKARPGNIDAGMINSALARVRRRFHYTRLTARFLDSRNEFEIDGAMSPDGPVMKTPPKRPTQNSDPTGTASRAWSMKTLVKRSATRSSPSGSPPHWAAVEKIKTRSGRSALYIRGHILSGFFWHGHAENLTPISRDANALMATGAETPVRRTLPRIARASGRQPIYSYGVRLSGTAGAPTLRRKVRNNAGRVVCTPVRAERSLYRTINFTITKKLYDANAKKWSRAVPGPNPGAITNVPPFKTGNKEPC